MLSLQSQTVQQVALGDPEKRKQFSEWFIQQHLRCPLFLEAFIASDEANLFILANLPINKIAGIGQKVTLK